MSSSPTPPALAALAAFPHLRAQCARALAAQAVRVAERSAQALAQPALTAALDQQISLGGGRLIALEAAPGQGLTTLICRLATERPYAFWLPHDDAGEGLAVLCAQVLALAQLLPALLPPAADRDSITLEQLLSEAGAHRPAGDPLVVLIGRRPDDQLAAQPAPFPALIPPGVVLVQACAPGEPLPLPAQARLRAADYAPTHAQLAAAAEALGCAPALAATIADAAECSLLYVRLAVGLHHSGALPQRLPRGLLALHQGWWRGLDRAGRRVATLLAAAGEPIEPVLLAGIAGIAAAELAGWLQRWQPLIETTDRRVALYHPATRVFIRDQSSDRLARAHALYVEHARARLGRQLEQLGTAADGYLVHQLARHVALSDPKTQRGAAPALATRGWAVARERVSGSMRAAAHDMAWVLRATAAQSDLLQLVRHAALSGTLAHLGCTLHPDAPAEAFEAAIAQGSARDATLRRVRAILAQTPDSYDKAQALRRLGEVCYTMRMRTSAMRMLSEALDLETPGPSRQWRDGREETLVAFARAAITIDMPQTALGITARIGHAERRGMIETEVMRWLLARGQLTRAEEVAYAIGHTAMHEWAMAEVAVGHVYAGDAARGEVVLGTLKTETAIAWARTELACEAARRGDQHAIGQLAPINNPGLLDRALAMVALALAAGGHAEAAIEAARTVEDRAVRTRALIELAQLHAPNASALLSIAADELAGLTGDERAPLVAELAAAQATAGRLEIALRTAELLAEDEERDRAQSRVAVALARAGNAADAQIVAEAIGDDDERDWAFDELARLSLARAEWDAALVLTQQIVAQEQRAHTTADVLIAWARGGHAGVAHDHARRIDLAAARMRALMVIADALVQQGQLAIVHDQIAQLADPDQRSRYQGAAAAALAGQGALTQAYDLALAIARPAEQTRALAAVAQAATPHDPALARLALAQALQASARLGRSETFRCLEWAAAAFAQLAGPELLLGAASGIDEIDSWWSS